MFTLKRVAVLPDGARGVLLCRDIPFAVTMERTYDDLHRAVKIPPGMYNCTRSRYFRGGYDTFEIHVPGHSRILFHKGNWETDSEGCVLIGESFARLKDKEAIADSSGGFGEFMALAQGVDSFSLTVIHCGV